jgi:hypothetical protein
VVLPILMALSMVNFILYRWPGNKELILKKTL